jgi:uncharacterized DUF497 family protein
MCGKEEWLASPLEPGMTGEVCTIGLDLAKNVFQVQGDIRLISARKASKHEREKYQGR